MKTISFRGIRIMTVAMAMLLLGRTTGHAQDHTKSFLKHYDLSTTVINPDTAPTDEIYSWWTEAAKKEWDEDWWKYEAKPHGQAPQVEGHYDYAHAFSYDLHGNHFDVYETGTMDFAHDGSALDSARQVYVATLKEGGTATIVFNYVSPSRWLLEGEDFHFSGIKDSFRMEVVDMTIKGCDPTRASELAQEIVKVVGGSIDYKYKFHLDLLTDKKMQWSFTYRDGHSDTWEFYRNSVGSRGQSPTRAY